MKAAHMAHRVKHIPGAEVTSIRKRLLRKEVMTIMNLEIHSSLQTEYQEMEVSVTVPREMDECRVCLLWRDEPIGRLTTFWRPQASRV